MTQVIDLNIKNPYRNKPSETEGARARRIQAEVSLKNAYMKEVREASKADGHKLELALGAIKKGQPWEGKEAELKLLLGRAQREVDRLLAAEKANEYAREMIRIKFATDKSKPVTKSSRRKR